MRRWREWFGRSAGVKAFAAWLAVWCVAAGHAGAAESQARKIVLLGHGPDHPYRTHCYLPDCELLAKCLRQTPGVEAVVHRGWPEDPKVLAGAHALVLHVARGGDFLFDAARRAQALELLHGGMGLAAIHWGTGAANDNDVGPLWQRTLGGHYHREFARYLVERTSLRPASEGHPICRGWEAFDLEDEFYIHVRFQADVVPVAVARVAGEEHTIAWAYQRHGGRGGRSFGFVAGHFHDNFGLAPFRRCVVNGILWAAGLDVPAEGAPCDIEPADLELPEEFERLKP
jgi:hypothetical protein